jgi:hypothetical protein
MSNTKKCVAGVVLLGVFGSGFALGYLSAPSTTSDDTQTVVVESELRSYSDPAESVGTTSPSSLVRSVSEAGVTLDTSALTDGQRTLLESLGVDTDSITLTPDMIVCAEAKIESERLTAIKKGDTPSFFEGAKLMTCYTVQ